MFPKGVHIIRLTTNLKKITAVLTLNVFSASLLPSSEVNYKLFGSEIDT